MFRTLTAVLAMSALVLTGCGDDDRETDTEPPEDSPPEEATLEITAAPDVGSAPLTVEFTVEGGGIHEAKLVDYHWEFGDSGTSTDPEPSHTYTTDNVYMVYVEVTIDRGTTEFGETEVFVETPRFDEWAEGVNEACMESSGDAMEAEAAAGGDPTSPEALAAFVDITNAETAAIESLGVPDERSDEARTWLALRSEGALLFVEIASGGVIDNTDPRLVTLDSLGIELSAKSSELGLTECVGSPD